VNQGERSGQPSEVLSVASVRDVQVFGGTLHAMRDQSDAADHDETNLILSQQRE
jgi:hypothetical protein